MKFFSDQKFSGGGTVSPRISLSVPELFIADVAAYDRSEGRDFCPQRAELVVWAGKILSEVSINKPGDCSDEEYKNLYRDRLKAGVRTLGDEREVAMVGVNRAIATLTANERLEVLSLFESPATTQVGDGHAALFSRAAIV